MYPSLNQQSAAVSTDSQDEPGPAKPNRPKLQKQEKLSKYPLSKRSGGPNTSDGKKKSAQNSTKHGGYALQSTQSSEEFYRFEQEVYGRLEPNGVIELELASNVAFSLWQSKLIQRYVKEALVAAEFDDVSLQKLALLTDFPFMESYQYLLNANENQDVRVQRLAKFWATCCEGLSDPDSAEDVIVAGDWRIREIYQEGIQVLGKSVVQQSMHEKFFNALDRVMHETHECKNSLGIWLREMRDLTELVNYWIYRNSARISAARKMIHEQDALKILCDPNIERAQSSASRAFQRQLDIYWLVKNKQTTTGRNLDSVILVN